MWKQTVVAAAVVVLAGCTSSTTSSTGGSASTPEPAAPSSTCAQGELGSGCWDDYGPAVKARIDKAVAAGNCAKLQAEFDTADANGNPDLMTYIDEGMQSAGCYD